MRIGLFTDSYPPFINGVSTSVETLKNALEEKGHIVYVVTVGQDATTYSYDEEKRILKVPGLPTGIYDYRAASIYPVKVIKTIKSWELDIIHSHTEMCMGIFARLLAKQYHIPLVHTYHTMYKDYTYYISRNHKYFDMGCKKAVEYLSKFYCDDTANAFIVPTIKTYHLFRDEYHYNKEIYIVPTGIDSSRFNKENVNLQKANEIRKKLGYKKNDFVYLFVGRMAQEKNILFLLDAMSKIKSRKNNIKLLLIGDGPDKDEYESKMKELVLQDSVKFFGSAPWNDMPLYYHMCQAFVTASVTETQGLTVIEALAAEKPVLCIEDEAFHTMVVDKLNGMFFNDIENCASKMLELAADKKEYNSLLKHTKGSIKQYSLTSFADNVLEVYKVAIENFNNKKDFSNMVHNTVKKLLGKKDGSADEGSLKS